MEVALLMSDEEIDPSRMDFLLESRYRALQDATRKEKDSLALAAVGPQDNGDTKWSGRTDGTGQGRLRAR